MLTPDQALKIVLRCAPPLGSEWVKLGAANGRVLAAPVCAADDLPRFDNSAMDGFAVRAADLRRPPVRLKLTGEARAGASRTPRVQPGCAIRISTGAPIPPGADTVVIQENCGLEPGVVIVRRPARKGANIRRRGEEIRRGRLALRADTVLNPGAIAWLATMGVRRVPVVRRPIVGVLRSGDEVVSGCRPSAHKVRDAHGVSIGLALGELGIEPRIPPPVSDNFRLTARRFNEMLAGSDVLITTGGVSVGDHDLLVDAAEAAGVQLRFRKVAQKPGKPLCFGTRGRKIWIGLPGNPVSALVCFYLYAKPALLRMMGRSAVKPLWRPARLKTPVWPDRRKIKFIPGAAVNGHVELPAQTGSHCLGSFAAADVLARIKPGKRPSRRIEVLKTPARLLRQRVDVR